MSEILTVPQGQVKKWLTLCHLMPDKVGFETVWSMKRRRVGVPAVRKRRTRGRLSLLQTPEIPVPHWWG